jgi:hypothetical protein
MTNIKRGPWATDSDAGASVANPGDRPYDEPMTEFTRQQAVDLLAASEAKVDARLANFDTSVKTGFAELRAEFAGLRTEMANGRTEAAKQNNESLRWIIGSVFTFVSISVAIIGVLINFSKADKGPPPAPVQPTPIIIYGQPAPSANSPATAQPSR